MTKQQTVELLQKQLPGFYSVDQVIKMINDIEEDSQAQAYNEGQLQDLQERINEKVSNVLNRLNTSDIADFDSAEFELNGNEISLYDISINVDSIIDEIDEVVGDVLHDFFPAPTEVV